MNRKDSTKAGEKSISRHSLPLKVLFGWSEPARECPQAGAERRLCKPARIYSDGNAASRSAMSARRI